MAKERRLMAFPVANYFLIEMMTKGWESIGVLKCVEGVPETAVFQRAFTDPYKDIVYFVFSDDSFPIVGLGEMMLKGEIQHEHIPFELEKQDVLTVKESSQWQK